MEEETIDRSVIDDEEIPEIRVVDSMCGTGKTSAAINMINDPANNDKKFMYITPFLEEVERIIQSCPMRNFVQPRDFGSKLANIKRLIEQGRNIASTHALFALFTPEIADLVYAQGYTLIMDEVADVVREYDITDHDLTNILDRYAKVEEDGRLVWTEPEYRGEYDEYKRLIDLGAIYLYRKRNEDGTYSEYENVVTKEEVRYTIKDAEDEDDDAEIELEPLAMVNRSKKKRKIMIWAFPVKCFTAFDEIYVLTYLFEAQIQKYYYDMYNLSYKYIYVTSSKDKGYEFTESPVKYDLSKFNGKLHILDREKLNKIGKDTMDLSKSWFYRNHTTVYIHILKKNTKNFFVNICKTPTSKNLWTTFKTYKRFIAGQGYSKGFLSCNARASNAYRDRIAMAYLCNRFLKPTLKNFFVSKGIEVDENGYALSELIQWLFRSAIRAGEEVKLYIPSARMRELIETWAKEHGILGDPIK